ncbi:MAG: class I SAM-dependent methyltransferase [Acidobacteria bacterium]|nr:class I SAM-dependent methyltransferase [Acidobacteriota bacterium]
MPLHDTQPLIYAVALTDVSAGTFMRGTTGVSGETAMNSRVEWPKTGFSHRIHAWMLAHLNARYERLVADRKRAMLANLRGCVVEIGPGTGPNLPYYPKEIRWIGVEPNRYMMPYVKRAAEQFGLTVDVRPGLAEEIPVAQNSADAVVSTLVLCSVSDPERVLREVLRVLKPGGRFLFIEHVAAPRGSRLRRVQDWLRPLWTKIGDGCHPNRETWQYIESAGFASVQIEHFRLPLGPVSTQIAGTASK